MKTKAAKVQQFLLQQQLPDDIRVSNNNTHRATSTTPSSSSTSLPPCSSTKIVTASDHVHRLALETCQCVHLQEYLPHILDLELVRAVKHPRGYLVANPVHSLHLGSQLENSNPASSRLKPPPVLYGEEQQRTMAMQTEGIVEYWCPLSGYDSVIRDDTAVAEVESLPKLPAMPQQQQQQSSSINTTAADDDDGPASKKQKLGAEPVTSSDAAVKESSDTAKDSATLSECKPTTSEAPTDAASTKEDKPLEATEETASTAKDASDMTAKTSTPDAESTKDTKTDDAQTAKTEATEVKDVVMATSEETPATATAAKDIVTQEEETTTAKSSEDKQVEDTTKMDTDLNVVDSSPTETTEVGKKDVDDKMDTSIIEMDNADPVSKDESSTDKVKVDAEKAEAAATTATTPDHVKTEDVDMKDNADENKEQEEKSTFNERDKDVTTESAVVKEDESPETTPKETRPVEGHPEKDKITSDADASAVLSKPEGPVVKADATDAQEQTIKEESPKDTQQATKPPADTDHTDSKDVDANKIESTADPSPEEKEIEMQLGSSKKDTETVKASPEKPDGTVTEVGPESLPPPSTPSTSVEQKDNDDPTKPGPKEKDTKEASNASKSVLPKPHEESQSDEKQTTPKTETDPTQASAPFKQAVPDQTSSTSQPTEGDLKDPIAVVATSESSSDPLMAASTEVPAPVASNAYLDHLHREEERIRLIRRSLSTKRIKKKTEPKDTGTVAAGTKKKRKRDPDIFKANIIPGWRTSAPEEFDSEQEEEWLDASRTASETVERWVGNYRMCRESYWMEKKQEEEARLPKQPTFYLQQEQKPTEGLQCQLCALGNSSRCHPVKKSKKEPRVFSGDELSMCLECSFVGCSPPSFALKSRKHILQHLLVSGHKFAVTCGEKARIFCFKCGDFVYHEVFEQEKIRIDSSKRLDYMGWKDHAVLRSFDAFQFLKTQDHGIVWRGLIATYPPIVPKEHFLATQLTMRRQALFEGRAEEDWVLSSPNSLRFTAAQHSKSNEEKYKLVAPVGIYNHGNTCYMSSIVQCLMFCPPLQDYFLKHLGHHHKACEQYRHETDAKAAAAKMKANASKSKKVPVSSTKSAGIKTSPEICLACEMDSLFLTYFGSANGVEMHSCIEESCHHLLLGNTPDESFRLSGDDISRPAKGSPLMITDLITSAWKCGGMEHLAGYEQRDAHEFLNAFLELLGKHIVKFRERIYSSITFVDEENALTLRPKANEIDIISQLFEGSLRSVLLCERCGVKRVQLEPFVNISLSLSEEVERMQRGKGRRILDISVETCLEHFVLPEKLGDLVYCASCGKKTETKKQHTFAKLPKILCLHLKRFDAAQNRKIDNFVSFPAQGLNMGSLLSHWCEVTRLESSSYEANDMHTTEPIISYDLFGTANHKGSMQSGHYVSNVKVGEQWYSCNDQTVCHATEESVLKADGAYVLFYIRKDAQ